MEKHTYSSSDSTQVAIVGAGFGGIGMGIALKRAGMDDFIIVDRQTGPGGVWEANRYPGAACDVPSHLYSFSFEPWPRWSRRYAPQSEIRDYLRHCVKRYELGPHLRLGQCVEAAEFDEGKGRWRIRLGDHGELEAQFLISAVGQLSIPAWPSIAGLRDFRGPVFHSASWDDSVELKEKRIGVIGTGASAIQFVPEVARRAGKVSIFQRNAPFVFPKFDRRYGAWEHRIRRHAPILQRADRAAQWLSHEIRGLALLRARWLLKGYEWRYRLLLRRQFRDRRLREQLWPNHPLGCKRILFSNAYLKALGEQHVDLVTTPIDHVTTQGIRTTDDKDHGLDVIILGTGFKTTDFLSRIEVLGRDGHRLAEAWREGAHAYLGVTVPRFPNLFLLYGPNTNLGHNSIIFMLERQIAYVMKAVQMLREHPEAMIEVDSRVEQRFNDHIQSALARSVWASGCDNWYRLDSGRIVNNWPGLALEYALATRRFKRSDYRVSQAGTRRTRPVIPHTSS